MKSNAFHLSSPDAKANCIASISLLEVGDDFVVTIKSAKESRSDAQQRLRWVWLSQMAKELAGVGKGRTKEQWNLYYKHTFVPDLLIEQDEDYVETFDIYRDTCKALIGRNLERYQTNFWDRVISTKDMSVKSMSAWLGHVDDNALHQWAIELKTPQDLGWII